MTLSGLKAQSQLCIFNTSQASSTTAMHQRISQATPRGVWSSTFLQKPIFPLLTMSLLCVVLSCLNFCLSFALIKGLGVFTKQKEIQLHVYILQLPTTRKWLKSTGLSWFINCQQTCDQQDVRVAPGHDKTQSHSVDLYYATGAVVLKTFCPSISDLFLSLTG